MLFNVIYLITSLKTRGLIYNRCVRTKRALKEAYATSYAKGGIYKNKLDGNIFYLNLDICSGCVMELITTEVPTPPVRTWLAGCIMHRDLSAGGPEVEVKINGRPFPALLDSGSPAVPAWYSPASSHPAGKPKPPSISLVCMETRDTYRPREWPSWLHPALGRWKWE